MVWGHAGCDAAYRIKLSVCPRCGAKNVMEEISMPKITKYGGHTNAGLTERAAGLVDTTAATLATAKTRAGVPAPVVSTEPDPDPVEAPFDPSGLSVADVLALRDDCTDTQWALVLDAERAGKNRKGLVGERAGKNRKGLVGE